MKNKLVDFGLLWLRLALGLGAMYHGWMKVTGAGGLSGFAEHGVAPMGFPLPIVFAILAAGGELIGGFFVLLGLWTRFAAAWSAAVWLTAFFIFHRLDPFQVKELAAAYSAVAVAIIIAGPGRFSADGGGKGGKRSSSVN
jgi:putative oxidoreductase